MDVEAAIKQFNEHLDKLAEEASVELDSAERQRVFGMSVANGFSPEATEQAFAELTDFDDSDDHDDDFDPEPEPAVSKPERPALDADASHGERVRHMTVLYDEQNPRRELDPERVLDIDNNRQDRIDYLTALYHGEEFDEAPEHLESPSGLESPREAA